MLSYWKSLWVEKIQYNERVEWRRREQRMKINNTSVDSGTTQIKEVASFLSKEAYNWKSPGKDQIQNYWLEAFPAAHRHTWCNKKLQCNNEAIEEGTGLTNHRNNLFATKIRRQQGSQKLPTHYVHYSTVHTPNKNNNQKNFHRFGRAELTTNSVKRMSSWK